MTKILFVCFLTPQIGIGHLSRLLAVAETLSKDKIITPEFVIFGNEFEKKELKKYKVYFFSKNDEIDVSLNSLINKEDFKSVIFDFPSNYKNKRLEKFFRRLKTKKISLVGIDSLTQFHNFFNIIWIPSFYYDCSKFSGSKCIFKSGWDSFLIQKRFKQKDWNPGSKVLVLTGGSDVTKLSEVLPGELEKIPNNIELNWVKGPFAKKPLIPENSHHRWIIHDSPQNIDKLIVESNYALTVFGVSFFEVLQYGIPSVVFSPYDNKDNDELEALKFEKVAMVAGDYKNSVQQLIKVMSDNDKAVSLSKNALKRMTVNGVTNLSKEIYSLVN